MKPLNEDNPSLRRPSSNSFWLALLTPYGSNLWLSDHAAPLLQPPATNRPTVSVDAEANESAKSPGNSEHLIAIMDPANALTLSPRVFRFPHFIS
jgi:hypothetical protein